MKRWIKNQIVNIICVLVICVIVIFLGYHIVTNTPAEDKMQVFPSYDWGAEDEEIMAYIAANTDGTDKQKQLAVINCLDYMWEYKKSAEDYVHYEDMRFYTEPSKHDYELVDLIPKQQWAED